MVRGGVGRLSVGVVGGVGGVGVRLFAESVGVRWAGGCLTSHERAAQARLKLRPTSQVCAFPQPRHHYGSSATPVRQTLHISSRLVAPPSTSATPERSRKSCMSVRSRRRASVKQAIPLACAGQNAPRLHLRPEPTCHQRSILLGCSRAVLLRRSASSHLSRCIRQG